MGTKGLIKDIKLGRVRKDVVLCLFACLRARHCKTAMQAIHLRSSIVHSTPNGVVDAQTKAAITEEASKGQP